MRSCDASTARLSDLDYRNSVQSRCHGCCCRCWWRCWRPMTMHIETRWRCQQLRPSHFVLGTAITFIISHVVILFLTLEFSGRAYCKIWCSSSAEAHHSAKLHWNSPVDSISWYIHWQFFFIKKSATITTWFTCSFCKLKTKIWKANGYFAKTIL